MQLTKGQYFALRRLIDGESLPSSALRQTLAEELKAEGLLTVRARGSRRSYSAIDTAELLTYLCRRYEEFRADGLFEDSKVMQSRAAQAIMSGNSKLKSVRSCPGFPVNSFEPVSCKINGTPISVAPVEGTFLFITDWRSFSIPAEVVIVGIENMENFRLIRSQRQFFKTYCGDSPLLFVSRYPQSTDLREWLMTVPNSYVHFGDFDLAGINIFITEFQQYLGARSSFLIPADIEHRIVAGSAARYDTQYRRFAHLTSGDPQLQRLIDLINKYHRCYDQEGYISE